MTGRDRDIDDVNYAAMMSYWHSSAIFFDYVCGHQSV